MLRENLPPTRKIAYRSPWNAVTCRRILSLLVCVCLASFLGACGSGLSQLPFNDEPINGGADNNMVDDDANGDVYDDSIDDTSADNAEQHDDADDYVYDDDAVTEVTLNGNPISVSGNGASVDGSTVTITAPGTYNIAGSLDDGQIIVDTGDADSEDAVQLVLDGVDINSSTTAPIYVVEAAKAIIILAEDSDNYITDGASYLLDDPESDEPNAAVFSKGALSISGEGSLTVDANYNDGIASKDGLIIESGVITVCSADDGIRGKDYVIVKGGTITIDAEGDGIKSDNDGDNTKGYISIEAGMIDVTAGADALDAATDVLVAGGDMVLVAGGGSNGYNFAGSESLKGIKGSVSVIIDGGTIDIDSADDGIHSNGSVTINGGSFVISSGDDGVHGDSSVEVNGGEITILESYEGIESRSVVSINDGTIDIVASDDGLNVAGGVDGSGFRPGRPDDFMTSGDCYLYINGGSIVVDADGDGIDVNGTVTMKGGTVVVSGPTSDANGALDHGSFTIDGGVLVAAGSAGMAQGPGSGSSQYSVQLTLGSSLRGGTVFYVETSSGEGLFCVAPEKQYRSVAFSSPELEMGATYNVYYGGSVTGEPTDGFYQDGTYTPGTTGFSLQISGTVTRINTR